MNGQSPLLQVPFLVVSASKPLLGDIRLDLAILVLLLLLSAVFSGV